MSSIAAVPQTYKQVLKQAEDSFNGCKGALTALTGEENQNDSLKNLIKDCQVHVQEMKSAPRNAETYEGLKGQFIVFTKPLLAVYKSALAARDLGLAAIQTIRQSQSTCQAHKKTPAELAVITQHLTWMEFPNASVLHFNAETEATIVVYPFDAQIKELIGLTATVGKQIKRLEGTLNTVFYTKKVIEGKASWLDSVPSLKNYYLNKEIDEARSITLKPARKISVSTDPATSSTQ